MSICNFATWLSVSSVCMHVCIMICKADLHKGEKERQRRERIFRWLLSICCDGQKLDEAAAVTADSPWGCPVGISGIQAF